MSRTPISDVPGLRSRGLAQVVALAALCAVSGIATTARSAPKDKASCVKCTTGAPAWALKGTTDKPMAGVATGPSREVATLRALVLLGQMMQAASDRLATEFAAQAAKEGDAKSVSVPRSVLSMELCGVTLKALRKSYSAKGAAGEERYEQETIQLNLKGPGKVALVLKHHFTVNREAGQKRDTTQHSLQQTAVDATVRDLYKTLGARCQVQFAETEAGHVVRVQAVP